MTMFKLKTLQFSYTADEAAFSANTTGSVRTDDAALEVSVQDDVLTAKLTAFREIRIDRLRAVFECDYAESDRIFLNGYQSWTDSYEHTIHDKMHGLERIPRAVAEKYAFAQYGDYGFTTYDNEAGRLHGWTYGYIRTGPIFRFIGSAAEDSGFTLIRTDVAKGELIVEKDCRGLHVEGDYEAFRLLLTEGNEQTVFDRYFGLLGVTLRPETKPVFGYTSWYRHYQNISDTIIREDLAGLLTQKYQANVFQIDDGYQTAVGDWLSVDEQKFPDGMQIVAEKIKEHDILPGIWMAPFVCEQKSNLYRDHKDWLVTDENGYYVKGGSNWSGFFALDIYNEEFRAHLREVFRTVTQDWGYKLLKLDFLYAACIVPRWDKTRGQVMADAMSFLREIAGDAFILGCGVPLAAAFGRVDYCRIGCDVCPDWDDKPHRRLAHRERVSTKYTVLDTVFRRQLNGRVFLSDPDVFMLRETQNTMTGEQRLCLAEVNALCGSVLFTSDNAAEYNDDQEKVLDRLMRLQRDGEIISAEISNGLLKLEAKYHNKLVARIYPL